jgi:hypothetical protein
MINKNTYFESSFLKCVFFVFVLAAVIASLSLIPLIPVNGGLGWDGSVYFSIVESWSNGRIGMGSVPYYFFRFGSILHLLPIQKAFDSQQLTISAARVFSSLFANAGVLLAVAASLKSIRKTSRNVYSHILVGLGSCATFAVFVMPSFYPVLSDHLGIFVSGACLYTLSIWDGWKLKIFLLLTAAFSILVMPPLFLIPAFFLMFPISKSDREIKKLRLFFLIRVIVKKLCSSKFWTLLKICFPIFSVLCIFLLAASVSDQDLVSRPTRTFAGLLELKFISLVILSLSLGVIAYLFLASLQKILPYINIINFLSVILVVGLFLWAITLLPISWDSGFKSPNLINNFLLQGLSSPLSSAPAIFSYYGPIGILGILSGFILSFQKSIENCHFEVKVVTTLALFFVIFLFFGNETRQFICVFPILVFLSCRMLNDKLLLSTYFSLFSISLLFIGNPMGADLELAISQKMDFMAWPWQSYFGHQGPWMSIVSRLLWSQLLILFLLGYFVLEKIQKRTI